MNKRVKLGNFLTSTSKIAVVSAMCLMALAFAPSLVRAQTNLLLNADLTAGSGDTPQDWEHSQYGARASRRMSPSNGKKTSPLIWRFGTISPPTHDGPKSCT